MGISISRTDADGDDVFFTADYTLEAGKYQSITYPRLQSDNGEMSSDFEYELV